MSTVNPRNFNGSTLTLGGTAQGGITGISVNQGGAKIDVYEPGDLVRLMELGVPTFGVTVSLRGFDHQPTLGAHGTLAITLANGSTLTIPSVSFEIMAVSFSGREDGAWEGSVEYSPSTSTT